MRIYADNAATTKISEKALRAMVECSQNFIGNPSSLHTSGQLAAEELNRCRTKMAELLGAAEAREIYFTSGGSEADNQAIFSTAYRFKSKGKTHIVSTAFEHHAVLHVLNRLEKEGFEITLVPVNENGIVKVEDIEAAITDKTCLVSVMMANNEIGTIQPIAEIGKLCRDKGVLFHTDAVQGVGHIKINVEEMNIDLLSLSAHKFNGPRGVGALYARRGVILKNLIEGGAQERGKRAGTENLPAIAGMVAALEDAIENLDAHAEKLIKLRTRLIDGILTIPHAVLNGDAENRLPGNTNFCFEGIEGESLLLWLDDKGVEASSGSACTSGSLDPSHVLLAIGRPKDVAHGSLRLTLAPENTEEEVDYIVSSVKEVVEYLRSMSPVWEELENGEREFIL